MSEKVHFIGIGGIGTSALARWYLTRNWRVSGSDVAESKLTGELKEEGATIKIGHKKSNLKKDVGLVIYNQAIPPSNQELLEAQRRKIKIKSYPEALGELTRKYKTIAIAGAHGKSTTTSMVALILIKAGFDPTVIVGTRLKEFGNKNFRRGKSNYLIIEADEFKASFLNYSPALAIITNIDREHLDFYKDFRAIKKSFLQFIKNIKIGGVLILNRDDKNLFGLKKIIQLIVMKNRLKMFWYSLNSLSVSKVKRVLKVPGRHNLSNALGAYTLAAKLGLNNKIILSALGRYHGVWRRLEYRGQFQGAKIFDDYAHHPTEIKASLQALREKYSKSKIICVFQPHQAERLKLLFEEFVSSFNDANNLILLKTYEVSGRDRHDKNFTSQKLARAIIKRKKSPEVIYSSNSKRLLATIKKLVIPDSIVVMIGAGDIVKYTNLLLR